MPTYQYTCTDCGEHLEVVQKFADEPLTVCPSCEGRLRKVFSAVGVVFKGSGFYRTDSRASSSTGGAKSSDGAAAKDGKASGKSDGGTSSGTGTSSSSSSSSKESSGSAKKSGEKVA